MLVDNYKTDFMIYYFVYVDLNFYNKEKYNFFYKQKINNHNYIIKNKDMIYFGKF